MSASTLNASDSSVARQSRIASWMRTLLRGSWKVVSSPLRLFLSIRRSMTGASVTLLVIGIVTLNIIWGYPWIGMFSACLSMFVIGWSINRALRPKIALTFSLPQSAPAGQPISLMIHGRNVSRFPVMDMELGLCKPPKRSRRGKSRDNNGAYRVLSKSNAVDFVESGKRFDLPASVQFEHRGVHSLPDCSIVSNFPFHLFRSSRRQRSDTEIAITPRPLTGDEDASARAMLDAFGGWSHRLLSGDALDYTGSREYEVGMPVRRWDFASWARLGKPIVREFQSPSIQLVTLIIDTGREPQKADVGQRDAAIERSLSLAATAINVLAKRMVRIRLCLTSEPLGEHEVPTSNLSATDAESMLIRLAAAEAVTPKEADLALEHMLERIGRTPAMVITSRHEVSLPNGFPPSVSLLRVDAPHENQSVESRRPTNHRMPSNSRETGAAITESSPA